MKQKDKFDIIKEVGYLQGTILGIIHSDIPDLLKDKLMGIYNASFDRINTIIDDE